MTTTPSGARQPLLDADTAHVLADALAALDRALGRRRFDPAAVDHTATASGTDVAHRLSPYLAAKQVARDGCTRVLESPEDLPVHEAVRGDVPAHHPWRVLGDAVHLLSEEIRGGGQPWRDYGDAELLDGRPDPKTTRDGYLALLTEATALVRHLYPHPLLTP